MASKEIVLVRRVNSNATRRNRTGLEEEQLCDIGPLALSALSSELYQIDSRRSRWSWEARSAQDCGSDVDDACWSGDAYIFWQLTWPAHHERHMNRLPVQLLAMSLTPVLKELFTMIRRDDHEGVLSETELLERVEHTRPTSESIQEMPPS